MSGLTVIEWSRVLDVIEAGARDGFNVPEYVSIRGEQLQVAWSYDAGFDSVSEFEVGGPVVADVWLSESGECLKLALFSGDEMVAARDLDGVLVEDLVAAWPRLFGCDYAGELEEVAA